MAHRYLSNGSNTTVKSGPGQVQRVLTGGANGGTIFIVDSTSIGVTPNYPSQISSSSNLAVLGPMTATPFAFELGALDFNVGLTVSATSNATVTVVYS